MKKKWVIIIFVFVLVIFILGYLIIAPKINNQYISFNNQQNQYQPEFMTVEEKENFNLPEDSKIQVLKRGDNGQIDVYKIIRSEEDVENDPDSIEPIDPRY